MSSLTIYISSKPNDLVFLIMYGMYETYKENNWWKWENYFNFLDDSALSTIEEHFPIIIGL